MADYGNIAAYALTTLEQREQADAFKTDIRAWAQYMLGVNLWKRQVEIIESVIFNRNTAVAAGHGVGKSFVTAIATLWWVDTHPLDRVFVFTTAPTKDQVSGVIWREIKRWHTVSQQRYDKGLIDHPLPGKILGDDKWKLDDGTLIGQGRKPPDAKGDDAIQGFHADYMLAIGDEATGLTEAFIDGLGNITSSQFNRRLLICNPTDPSSHLGKLFKKNPATWNFMHISCYDSPKVNPDIDPDFPVDLVPGLVDMEYIEGKIEEYGEEDPRFIARVLGQWAFDADNLVFTQQDIDKAINTEVRPDPDAPISIGVDVARSQKGDFTTLYWAQPGDIWVQGEKTLASGEIVDGDWVNTYRRGLYVRKLDEWRGAPLSSYDPEDLGSAQKIDAHARAIGAKTVFIDASGLGMGVYDPMNKDLSRGDYEVVAVYGQYPPGDTRSYANFRAEQFFELKRRFFNGEIDIDGLDELLIEELQGIMFEYDNRAKLKIESKEDMRKRGVKSPDKADSLWYTCIDLDRMARLTDPGGQKSSTPAEEMFTEQDDQEWEMQVMSGPGVPL